jgi:hypothetical protein
MEVCLPTDNSQVLHFSMINHATIANIELYNYGILSFLLSWTWCTRSFWKKQFGVWKLFFITLGVIVDAK